MAKKLEKEFDVGEKSQTLSGLSDSSQILLISGDEVRVEKAKHFLPRW